jgi:3-oxo-5-alpha-steroid 4-dehydrogenase 1
MLSADLASEKARQIPDYSRYACAFSTRHRLEILASKLNGTSRTVHEALREVFTEILTEVFVASLSAAAAMTLFVSPTLRRSLLISCARPSRKGQRYGGSAWKQQVIRGTPALMPESQIHFYAVVAEVVFGAAAFVALFFITAPYGRHARTGWGPTVPARVGWIVMESPAALLFLAIFVSGEHRFETFPLMLLALWLWHYVHRTFVFPFLLPAESKRMPLSVVALAFVFNILNAYINARWLSHFGDYQSVPWPRFLLGALVFFTGFFMNVWADRKLLELKRSGKGYVIPHGGLYERISSPNYFGEIVEWGGYAIAAASLPALAFGWFTLANLAPRAWSHHVWYRGKFPNYPKERKALVPFLW